MGIMKRLIEERGKYRRSRNAGAREVYSELERFERDWTKNMGTYWRERMDRLGVNDTHALYNSIQGIIHPGPPTTIEHSFMIYGKYVSDGVGREFGDGYTDSLGRTYNSNRGGEGTWNDGQLPFLLPGGEEYREKHGLNKAKKVGPAWGGRVAGGHPRMPNDWFWRKYYASRMVLNEVEAAYYGQAYQGMLTVTLENLLGPRMGGQRMAV